MKTQLINSKCNLDFLILKTKVAESFAAPSPRDPTFFMRKSLKFRVESTKVEEDSVSAFKILMSH